MKREKEKGRSGETERGRNEERERKYGRKE